MKSIIIKGVILVHNEREPSLSKLKSLMVLCICLRCFFEGVDVITVLDFAGDSIPYHSTSVLKITVFPFL